MRKNILKLVVFTTILLMTKSILAQRGSGNRGQTQHQIDGQRELPKFNAKNAVGILKYDYGRVIKKTKIKKDAKKNRIAKIISDYNHIIDEIKFLHSEDFKAVENYVSIKREEARTNNDRAAMSFIHSEAMEQLLYIKRNVYKAEQTLNNQLEMFLTEKQFHKWRRLQRARKESLNSKTPDNIERGRPQKGGRRTR